MSLRVAAICLLIIASASGFTKFSGEFGDSTIAGMVFIASMCGLVIMLITLLTRYLDKVWQAVWDDHNRRMD